MIPAEIHSKHSTFSTGLLCVQYNCAQNNTCPLCFITESGESLRSHWECKWTTLQEPHVVCQAVLLRSQSAQFKCGGKKELQLPCLYSRGRKGTWCKQSSTERKRHWWATLLYIFICRTREEAATLNTLSPSIDAERNTINTLLCVSFGFRESSECFPVCGTWLLINVVVS